MRSALKTGLAALVGAALLAGTPLIAAAGPHGGMGGFGGAPRGGAGGFGGAPRFAHGPGGMSFGGPRGGMGFAGPRGGFGAGRISGFHGGFQRGESFRGGPTFAVRGGPGRGFRGGRGFTGWRGAGARSVMARDGGRRGGPAFASARFGQGRNRFAANGLRDGHGSFGVGRTAGAFASPAGLGARGWNEGFRGFDGWRGDRGWGPDWDDWLWPIGLGLALDWGLGYPPCPYWGYWPACWVTPYPAYWAGYWGPLYPWGPWGAAYPWGPAYAWDAVYAPGPGFAAGVGYDWDDDWRPVAYAALPPTEYAIWSPDDAWSPTYDYADYSPGACVGRRRVWDDDLGGYVSRSVYYPC